MNAPASPGTTGCGWSDSSAAWFQATSAAAERGQVAAVRKLTLWWPVGTVPLQAPDATRLPSRNSSPPGASILRVPVFLDTWSCSGTVWPRETCTGCDHGR